MNSAAEAAPVPAAKGRPKIGCCAWCFHNFAPGADPTEAIGILGELGFEGTDLIVNAPEDLSGLWTDAKMDAVRGLLEKNRVALAQFVLFQPVVEGLTSRDADERARALDNFAAGCRVGARLGAPLVNIVAPWPRELSRPGGGYLPRHYDLPDAKPGDVFRIEMAPTFDWDALWNDYVQTTRACLERAKDQGLRLTIEHHTHTMIPDAVSFLRLWEACGSDPALGYNLDTGWTLSQREYPSVAIHKTKRQLMNLHVRDIDGLMRTFVHVGEGVMPFRDLCETLRTVGYTGYVSLEQDKHVGDMKETCRRYLALMREYLGA